MQSAFVSQPDLDVVSRALFNEEQGRAASGKRDEQSIEDPLGDWPESSGEPDQWLREREEKDRGEQQG